MKKLCSLLLAVCLIIGIYTPARAAEVTGPKLFRRLSLKAPQL